MQNALHLILRHPDKSVYDYLVGQGVPIDATDFKGRNPFTISIDKYMLQFGLEEMSIEMQDLMQRGANFDQADQTG